jgi:ribosomal-protein-alanine N-acetyltransferase
MINKRDFTINPLNTDEVNHLYQFISDNSEHLKYYFPKTLLENETLEKSIDYIED